MTNRVIILVVFFYGIGRKFGFKLAHSVEKIVILLFWFHFKFFFAYNEKEIAN